jgi:hypothetical protein
MLRTAKLVDAACARSSRSASAVLKALRFVSGALVTSA